MSKYYAHYEYLIEYHCRNLRLLCMDGTLSKITLIQSDTQDSRKKQQNPNSSQAYRHLVTKSHKAE